MLSSKPLASLSSGLLARKGQAKPAMRPQGFGGFASNAAAALDDLGWNDMGSPEPVAPPPAPAPVLVMPTPAPVPEPVEAAPAPAPPPVPPVVSLRETLAERIEQGREPKPVSLATAARIGRESAKQTKSGKAAFTLRLDAERHLKLRLASALGGRSAQVLVTEAVDALLDTMPEVAALVAQLPEPKRRR